jgi:release factor glutamine methyltransferase
LDFYVNKHTLIPRPETELLVEEALQKINALTSPAAQQKILVVDVGTGSGCIPVAITKKIAPKQLPILAIDTAHAALKIAQKNAGQYHLHNIKFLKGSLIEPLTINQLNNYSTLLITANLPYLTEEQFIDEPSIQKEPYTALVAQENGLQLYRELLEQLSSLPSSIQTVYAFFEIDPSQTRSITSLIKKSLPGSTTTFKKDLAGRDRVVSISLTRNI